MVEYRGSFKNLCYGIPVDMIATWCEVDLKTARHWKAGTREPGRSAWKLFALHLEGQVVPAEWQGFSFRNGQMWDPYGKPFTRAQLRLYGIAWQIFREWTRDDAERRATLDDLMGGKNPHVLEAPPPPAERLAQRRIGASEPQASPSPQRRPETVRRAIARQLR